ncbi:pectate lyase [Paractinoplanes rishiriensis]|uniref:Pectate lyase n=1 Tax=Paractinoplanes rishiriensis TaxID=1050105 RepID=A0A919MU07_9ACTN|nr:pectate lyase [Actinoplanes rishiriensis]
MGLLLAVVVVLAGPAPAQAGARDRQVGGWASLNGGVTGGLGAPPESVTVVRDRAGLIAALKNNGNPTGPKIVQVAGTIEGNQAADGRLLGEQDYAPGYDLQQYMSCWVDGKVWSDSAYPYCKTMRQLRQSGSNAQKAQIQIEVPGNTTLVGLGRHARLNGVYLSIRASSNIIVRNLTLEAPVDHFTSWDGESAWNARFDALSVVTGFNLWIDRCTFTDGRYPDSSAPIGLGGKHVQHHDGLLDIEDGSDFVTVSRSVFENHDKSLLIGSGDSRAERDRGHLRITFHHNLFRNSLQRSPRVRFGQVHVYNNVYEGTPQYFLGLGIESKIYSEYNVFRYRGSPDLIVENYKGNTFRDHGSWHNGRRVDLNVIAEREYLAASAAAIAAGDTGEWTTAGFRTEVGWAPSSVYAYRPLRSAAAVTALVRREAGAGR